MASPFSLRASRVYRLDTSVWDFLSHKLVKTWVSHAQWLCFFTHYLWTDDRIRYTVFHSYFNNHSFFFILLPLYMSLTWIIEKIPILELLFKQDMILLKYGSHPNFYNYDSNISCQLELLLCLKGAIMCIIYTYYYILYIYIPMHVLSFCQQYWVQSLSMIEYLGLSVLIKWLPSSSN